LNKAWGESPLLKLLPSLPAALDAFRDQVPLAMPSVEHDPHVTLGVATPWAGRLIGCLLVVELWSCFPRADRSRSNAGPFLWFGIRRRYPQMALLETLTQRERQVLDLVVQGKMNKQIASELGATERTIKAHRHSVMEKLKVKTIAELVSFATRLGRRGASAAGVPEELNVRSSAAARPRR
jgi:DNA-binding CsgD family transcriptional regulator